MNNKAIKFGIGAAVLILAAFAVYLLFFTQDKNIIKEKDPGLSAEDRKIYEDRLAALTLYFEQATDDKQKYDALIQQGFQLYGLGRYQQAKDKYLEAAKIVPSDYTAQAALFEVEVAMNDKKAARVTIKKAINLNKSSADLWKKMIQLEMDGFNAEEHVINGLYIDALRETGGSIDAVTAYATWLKKVGNFQASKEYWQQAITLNPVNKAAYEQEIDMLDDLMAK